ICAVVGHRELRQVVRALFELPLRRRRDPADDGQCRGKIASLGFGAEHSLPASYFVRIDRGQALVASDLVLASPRGTGRPGKCEQRVFRTWIEIERGLVAGDGLIRLTTIERGGALLHQAPEGCRL